MDFYEFLILRNRISYKNIIQNYRSLKDITIDDLKQLNVFIGKNGSGKSHILEALELFFLNQRIHRCL